MTMDNEFDTEMEEQEVSPEEQSANLEEVIMPSPTREANGDDLADLFEVPDEDDPDMQTRDLLEIDVDEDIIDGDLSDITAVSREDIMGRPLNPKVKPKPRMIRRLPKRYVPPPSGMGGMSY